jgi:hypothetical protein
MVGMVINVIPERHHQFQSQSRYALTDFIITQILKLTLDTLDLLKHRIQKLAVLDAMKIQNAKHGLCLVFAILNQEYKEFINLES